MSQDILVPNEVEIAELVKNAATEEDPAPNPFAAYRHEVLTAKECDSLIYLAKNIEPEPGHWAGCDAVRRALDPEKSHKKILQKVSSSFLDMAEWWDFDLGHVSFTLMEYQEFGRGYAPHVDISPGTSRKLSATVQLSDPRTYDGGVLAIEATNDFVMPKARGTMIVFPAYMRHLISPLNNGKRWSLVVAAWGPRFR